MIIEILMVAFPALYVGLKVACDLTVQSTESRILEYKPEYSPFVQLVGELFQSDKGWTRSVRAGSIETFTHTHGVRIGTRGPLMHVSLDDNKVELTDDEKQYIRGQIDAYKSRSKNREQSELAKLLAQRVLNPGEVRPLLGAPGLPPADEDFDHDNGERAEHDPVPARYLTRTSDGQIVWVGDKDSEQRAMSRELAAHYGISNVSSLMNKIKAEEQARMHL